jgi:predicted nucleic acid-binding protein|tara:strand:+ start:418 stop:1593 length:1176 start_codon:yes stop_codon:yes gene_type:complete
MKKNLPHYFNENKKSYQRIWEDGIFVFDTNAILNLYRYSSDNTKKWIELLKKINDRTILPYQVADEFLKNRAKVISDRAIPYNKSIEKCQEIIDIFSPEAEHPFSETEQPRKIKSSLESLKSELEKTRDRILLRISPERDQILEQLDKIFRDCIAEEPSKEELDQIYADGKKRYTEGIPPGHKDQNKAPQNFDSISESEKNRIFGDLIIWKEILKISERESKDIIFVCNEKKEDWMEKVSGKIIGPSPALKREFHDTTGRKIIIYNSKRFMQLSIEEIGSGFSTENLDEATLLSEDKAIRQADDFLPAGVLQAEQAARRASDVARGASEAARRASEAAHPHLNRNLFMDIYENQPALRALLESQQEAIEQLKGMDINLRNSFRKKEDDEPK